jgi:hypothetical protein
MKATPFLLAGAVALAFACGAVAQQRAPAPSLSVLPPPGLHDLGVDTRTPAPPATVSGHPLPALPGMRDDGARDARGEPPPQVTVRTQGTDTVEEYRVGGKLTMIRIVPRHGIAQTYMMGDDNKLHPEPGEPPVKPVYYTIYEWGKPAAPANPSSSGGR